MLQSFFAQLFIALQERIKTAVPEIRWIDQDLGQLEYYEQRPAVSFPCVLIDFNSTTFDQESQLVQWGNVSIELRLAFPPFSSANNVAPAATKENALKYYELEQKLFVALHGWQPDSGICQPLTRISAATEKREDPFRVRSLMFTTAYEDDSATPSATNIQPDLEFQF